MEFKTWVGSSRRIHIFLPVSSFVGGLCCGLHLITSFMANVLLHIRVYKIHGGRQLLPLLLRLPHRAASMTADSEGLFRQEVKGICSPQTANGLWRFWWGFCCQEGFRRRLVITQTLGFQLHWGACSRRWGLRNNLYICIWSTHLSLYNLYVCLLLWLFSILLSDMFVTRKDHFSNLTGSGGQRYRSNRRKHEVFSVIHDHSFFLLRR